MRMGAYDDELHGTWGAGVCGVRGGRCGATLCKTALLAGLSSDEICAGSALAAEILMRAHRSARRCIHAQATVRYFLRVQAMRAGGALIFGNSSSEKVN